MRLSTEARTAAVLAELRRGGATASGKGLVYQDAGGLWCLR